MNRVLTAIVLVPIVLAVVIWAPPWLFATFAVLIALLGLREFYDLAQSQGVQPYRRIGLVATAALVLRLALPWETLLRNATELTAALLIVLMFAVVARGLSRPERLAASLAEAGATVWGVLYLGLCMGVVAAIQIQWGFLWLIFLLLAVWLGDVAALYGGKLLGRHRMAPRVSPNKTWEGAAFSFVAAVGVGFAFGYWFLGHSLLYAALAAAMNIAAQTGDLAESLYKRGAGLKDSGDLLPGHGGVLDRIDAMLLAAPVLWYYLAYFPR